MDWRLQLVFNAREELCVVLSASSISLSRWNPPQIPPSSPFFSLQVDNRVMMTLKRISIISLPFFPFISFFFFFFSFGPSTFPLLS